MIFFSRALEFRLAHRYLGDTKDGKGEKVTPSYLYNGEAVAQVPAKALTGFFVTFTWEKKDITIYV